MALAFEVIYHPLVREDILKLDKSWRRKIEKAIEEKLTDHPEIYGKPLRRSLNGYRKLRVGDYRVIFRIESSKVLILAIIHRSVVYLKAEGRL